jgi:hypothetical protein
MQRTVYCTPNLHIENACVKDHLTFLHNHFCGGPNKIAVANGSKSDLANRVHPRHHNVLVIFLPVGFFNGIIYSGADYNLETVSLSTLVVDK